MSAPTSKWDDLWVRIASAAAMLAIGGVEVWLGGLWFHVFAGLLIGVMIWELVRMLTGKGDGRAAQIHISWLDQQHLGRSITWQYQSKI